jgi:epoxyqueuosine reductase
VTSADKSRLVKKLARTVGFDLAGVAPAEPSARGPYYRDWLARGYAGSMAYLARNVELRLDPRGLLDGAKSIVAVAVLYKRADGYQPTPAPREPASPPTGRVAQYARGADYHVVMRRMLAELASRMRAELGEPFAARVCVDTAPILEREVAQAAGLGWIGKNTCVLNPALGSYLLLGELITTLELASDEPIAERCRTCTRCIDACPTGALVGPRKMDAARCIAYLTIEHRGTLPPDLQTRMQDWVFGCDICQQVCPYNAKAPLGRQPDVAAPRVPAALDLMRLLTADAASYGSLTQGTAMRRAKRAMLRRNALAAAARHVQDQPLLADTCRGMLSDSDPAVRAAARAAVTTDP